LLPHARVNVVGVKVGGVHETHGIRFLVDGGLTAGGAANVGGLVLLADLAVAVGDDVPWVGVDTQKPSDLSQDPGLFQAFPDRALGCGFANVLGATGKGPLTSITAALQQDRGPARLRRGDCWRE
jgi:hypothetical protein